MHGHDLYNPVSSTVPPVEPSAPRSKVRWIVGCVAAVVTLLGVAAILPDRGIVGQAVMRDTMTVAGIVKLTDVDGFDGHSTGGSCAGNGGYDDLAVGTSVTVYDGSSAIIGGGFVNSASYNGSSCVLSFEIPDIPSGRGFYQVEISHRGKISEDEKNAVAGTLYFMGSIG
jgi:hypothetical protein